VFVRPAQADLQTDPGGKVGTSKMPRPRKTIATTSAVLLSLLAGMVGCQTRQPEPIIAWELAQTVRIDPALTWHLRLTDAKCVPPELTRTLCEEYDALHVTSSAQWRQLRCCLGIPDKAPGRDLDFCHGSVFGIIARVGEPAAERWPIELDTVRLVNGNGWINLRFISGLYYPLQGPPFLYAAYVPGLRIPRIIQVDRLKFIITRTDNRGRTPSSSPLFPGQERRALKPGNSPC